MYDMITEKQMVKQMREDYQIKQQSVMKLIYQNTYDDRSMMERDND